MITNIDSTTTEPISAALFEPKEAHRNNPCPLCGHEHYCYLVPNQQGEIWKVVCQWSSADSSLLEGWGHSGTAKDGRGVFVNQALAPRKKRKSKRHPTLINLVPTAKIVPRWRDARIAPKPEEVQRGDRVQLKPGIIGDPSTIYEVRKIEANRKLGIGKTGIGLKLRPEGRSGELVTAIEDIEKIIVGDPRTGAKEVLIEYFYSDTQKVLRKQWTDRRAVYRNGATKEVLPYHLPEGSDTWQIGKGGKEWKLYHEEEAFAEFCKGGVVFAVAGEQAVEVLRSIGLTATCNQGGEGGFPLIADRLAKRLLEKETTEEKTEEIEGLIDVTEGTDVTDVAEECEAKPGEGDDVTGVTDVTEPKDNPEKVEAKSATEAKPLLVIWGDNDEEGRRAAKSLHSACKKKGITSLILNYHDIWSRMAEKGDCKDWADYCKREGIPDVKMIRSLELAIDAAIDAEEQEFHWIYQRSAWKSPVSYQGEIGFWRKETDPETSESKNKFEPACNFDFQVERELKDADGGGLVLQVKRSFEKTQYRVILNSTHYTTVDNFVDALKREIGTGVVCNLSKKDLNALIHTRIHEYRTTRRGRLYKRIDRYGQQQDGNWVFSDRQHKPNGTSTNENETLLVYNPSLGKDDFIPCPELAQEDPYALKRLLDSSRKFFGQKNINQVLLMMGWVVAGLHSQEIFRQNGNFPLFNAHGEPGSCKTLAAEAALSLIGKNWAQSGMLARVSVSALYEHGSRTGSLPFFWDDPDRNPENEELAKSWYNRKPRKVRGNEQTPYSPMGITSNHVFGGEQAATYTRFVRVAFERATGGNKAAFQELKAAQEHASGAFSQLIGLGFPRDAIAILEAELLQYLPLAHARIAQSLAIVTWYAQKLVERTHGREDVKEWVIENCCKTENDSDSAGDSLQDFIEKILALESEALVGSWNLRRDIERNGQKFLAIFGNDVWKSVDQRFKPATYNEKSIKVLIEKAGGTTKTTVRFAANKDQALAYERYLIAPQNENSSPPSPPELVPRKAWLIPMLLLGEEDAIEDVTNVTSCNQNLVTSEIPEKSIISTSCNHVTKNNMYVDIDRTEQQLNLDFTEEQKKVEFLSENLVTSVTTPKEEQKPLENQDSQPVTSPVTQPKKSVTTGYAVTSPEIHPALKLLVTLRSDAVATTLLLMVLPEEEINQLQLKAESNQLCLPFAPAWDEAWENYNLDRKQGLSAQDLLAELSEVAREVLKRSPFADLIFGSPS